MPDFTTEIDIDPSEYVSECSKREIKELIEVLIDDGHLPPNINLNIKEEKNKNILDEQWDNICEKIRTNRLNLSNDEEELIIKISQKF